MRRRDDRHKHSMPVKPSDAGRERRPINQVKARAGQSRAGSEGEVKWFNADAGSSVSANARQYGQNAEDTHYNRAPVM